MLDVQRLDGQGCVAARVGADDVFLLATDGKPMSASGIATDARIAAVGRRDGKPAWFLCVAGTRLEVDGHKLFEADRAVTAAFDNNGSGCVASDGPATLTLLLGPGGPAKMAVAAGTAAVKCLGKD